MFKGSYSRKTDILASFPIFPYIFIKEKYQNLKNRFQQPSPHFGKLIFGM